MFRVVLLCLASLVLSNAVAASMLEASWDWMASLEYSEQRESQYFILETSKTQLSFNALLDVELRYQNWLGVIAVKGNDLYSMDSDAESDAELVLRELFWQGPVSLSEAELDLTLGKQRIDWGVGYGYRPLDIITPYRRNPVGIQVEEGAGVAAASYFDEEGEWTFIFADSSWISQEGSEFAQRSEQQGAGIRRYALMGDSEWQGVVYYDDVRHGLIGGSWVTVMDDAWELHASSMYQRQYHSFALPKSLYEPVHPEKKNDGWQALIGLTWASQSGQSVVVEYWYDNRGWSQSQWRSAYQKAEQLSTNRQLDGLRSSYASAYQHVNLVNHNMMFHWTLDPVAWQQWRWSQSQTWLHDLTPTVDLLYSPDDKGVIATQWLAYNTYDSGEVQFEVELAVRFLTGDKQSVYRNLPDKRMILLNLKGRF